MSLLLVLGGIAPPADNGLQTNLQAHDYQEEEPQPEDLQPQLIFEAAPAALIESLLAEIEQDQELAEWGYLSEGAPEEQVITNLAADQEEPEPEPEGYTENQIEAAAEAAAAIIESLLATDEEESPEQEYWHTEQIEEAAAIAADIIESLLAGYEEQQEEETAQGESFPTAAYEAAPEPEVISYRPVFRARRRC
jgi:hypothetical protein